MHKLDLINIKIFCSASEEDENVSYRFKKYLQVVYLMKDSSLLSPVCRDPAIGV